MRLTDNRLTIIEKDGNDVNFPKTIGKQHQECLDEYSEMKHYDYSTIDHIIEKGNAVFYNASNGMFISCLPVYLDDEQLDTLDRLSLKMDDITYMEVRKYLESGYVDFVLDNNVGDRFADEVLQSYFKGKSK